MSKKTLGEFIDIEKQRPEFSMKYFKPKELQRIDIAVARNTGSLILLLVRYRNYRLELSLKRWWAYSMSPAIDAPVRKTRARLHP